MLETHGKHYLSTLQNLDLTGKDRLSAITNAESIIEKVVQCYEKNIGKGHVGKGGKGIKKNQSYKGSGTTGLVYGRIQSGKTRAMILSTAIAFDNGFRIVVVMTSNINDLVDQTHFDFTKDLKDVTVYSKSDELTEQVDDAKLEIGSPTGRILIVASKGAVSLNNITQFLKDIGAQKFPVLIFDDEGDQASLDNNNRKRSATRDTSLQKTKINKLISNIRTQLPASVYLSVTGTPQSVLLQSISSGIRPSFIHLLPSGVGYIGGDHFFDTDQPAQNKYGLIAIIPSGERAQLLNVSQPMPIGLKRSILFFLLSGSAAILKLGLPVKPHEKNKGYQFLCHPGLRNNEQDITAKRISDFLTEVKRVLMGLPDTLAISETIEEQFSELRRQVPSISKNSLKTLKGNILSYLRQKNILIINGENPKRRGIEYKADLNFLIGGNTLGRGIAIPNLLVTYYIRTTKIAQLDTMHQHARMFGYRDKTLPYTRLFTTNDLYCRFRDIHRSDKELRRFIELHHNSNPASFPVEISPALKATRAGVLEAENIEAVWPGMQIYPNYIKLSKSNKSYDTIMGMVAKHLKGDRKNPKDLAAKGKIGTIISIRQAIEIVKLIKTKSDNAWSDKTIVSVIEKLGQRLEKRVKLKFRNATRTIEQNGLLSSGTISGTEQNEGRLEKIPTLWIMSVTGTADSSFGAGAIFIYPTIVVPKGLPKVFVFNKK